MLWNSLLTELANLRTCKSEKNMYRTLKSACGLDAEADPSAPTGRAGRAGEEAGRA
jgi:hypothetical protein